VRQKKMTQAASLSREPSMEEILASIRRIIEDGNAEKVPEVAEVAASNADFDDFQREFAKADIFTAEEPEVTVAAVQPEALRPTYEPEMFQPRVIHEVQPARIETPFAQELRPIISEMASRQVAKSFENLSVALHEERNTSVAQMTEDMVRPMLQDWLDNNLPTLVERLVREEIERVSRGTR
jgi:uncharacterized protein